MAKRSQGKKTKLKFPDWNTPKPPTQPPPPKPPGSGCGTGPDPKTVVGVIDKLLKKL